MLGVYSSPTPPWDIFQKLPSLVSSGAPHNARGGLNARRPCCWRVGGLVQENFVQFFGFFLCFLVFFSAQGGAKSPFWWVLKGGGDRWGLGGGCHGLVFFVFFVYLVFSLQHNNSLFVAIFLCFLMFLWHKVVPKAHFGGL